MGRGIWLDGGMKKRTAEEVERLLKGYEESGAIASGILPAGRDAGDQVGLLPAMIDAESAARRTAVAGLVKVKLDAAPGAAQRYFAFVLVNGRHIESGWDFVDAEMVRCGSFGSVKRCKHVRPRSGYIDLSRQRIGGYAQGLRRAVRAGAGSVWAGSAACALVSVHQSHAHQIENIGMGWQRLMQSLYRKPTTSRLSPSGSFIRDIAGMTAPF
jgi:hypothetical protein